MGEPRELLSEKCLVTVLTLVWHVTYLTISGRGNIPSKLWAGKETAWTVSKDTQSLSNFWNSEKPAFQFGKPAARSSIPPNHRSWEDVPQGGSGNHFQDLLSKLMKIKWLSEGGQLSFRGDEVTLPKTQRHDTVITRESPTYHDWKTLSRSVSASHPPTKTQS